MPTIILPDQDTLKLVIPACRNLVVITPYYRAGGLRLLEQAIQGTTVEKIHFCCHLEIDDWVHEAIDPTALLDFILRNPGVEVSVAHSRLLHAKVYLSERNGLIGSANLTSQGFGSGLELLIQIGGKDTAELHRLLNAEIYPKLTSCTQVQLAKFISDNQNNVKQKRRELRKLHLARSSKKTIIVFDPKKHDHWKFLDFCATTGGRAASIVVDRGLGKGNLSGHIRSFYYASQQFLMAYPQAVPALSKIDPNSFRLPSHPLVKKWKKFVNNELKDIPEVGYVAKGTVTYLPRYAGGSQTSGGAGIGNLNRILPLVAKYIVELN